MTEKKREDRPNGFSVKRPTEQELRDRLAQMKRLQAARQGKN